MQNGLATGVCGPWGQVAANGRLTKRLQEDTGGITMITLLPFLLFLSILLPPLVIIYSNTSLSFLKKILFIYF